jgi:hypothetical protein
VAKIKNLTYTLLVFAFFACQKELTQQNYVKALVGEKGQLTKTQTLGEVNYSCHLQTPTIITLLNHKQPYSNQQEFEADKKDYENLVNFVLIIEDPTDSKNKLVKRTLSKTDTYSALLAYSGSALVNDFELNDTDGTIIPCALVHMEPANSIKPVIRITGSFKLTLLPTHDYTLVFNDNLFGLGKLKFYYSKELFANLPQLKL